jgi:hypothetical protein
MRNNKYRLPHQFDIQPPTHFFHVLDVVLDPLLKIPAAKPRSSYLPKTGDAGPHAESGLSPFRTVLVLTERTGPRSDHRHMAQKDIDELGEFVQVRLAQDATNPRDPRIVVDEELGAVGLIACQQIASQFMGMFPHRSKLHAVEDTPFKSFSLVTEEKWSAILKKDGKHDDWVERQCQKQDQAGKHHVENPFNGPVNGSCWPMEMQAIACPGWLNIRPAQFIGNWSLRRVVPQHRRTNNNICIR